MAHRQLKACKQTQTINLSLQSIGQKGSVGWRVRQRTKKISNTGPAAADPPDSCSAQASAEPTNHNSSMTLKHLHGT